MYFANFLHDLDFLSPSETIERKTIRIMVFKNGKHTEGAEVVADPKQWHMVRTDSYIVAFFSKSHSIRTKVMAERDSVL